MTEPKKNALFVLLATTTIALFVFLWATKKKPSSQATVAATAGQSDAIVVVADGRFKHVITSGHEYVVVALRADELKKAQNVTSVADKYRRQLGMSGGKKWIFVEPRSIGIEDFLLFVHVNGTIEEGANQAWKLVLGKNAQPQK